MNVFVNTFVRHADGIGVYFENADSNNFQTLRCTRLVSQSGDAVRFGEGIGATNNKYARTNHIFDMHTSQGRIHAEGTGTDFPSVDNIVYMNMDGAASGIEISRDTNARLTVVTPRQHDIPAQNLVAVGNDTPSNFHAYPDRSNQARDQFATFGYYPTNIYADGGKVMQFYDLPNDARYRVTAGSEGLTWNVPTNITDPKMNFTTHDINAGSYLVGNAQVLGAPNTGWGDPTGTSNKGTFDTGTVTLSQLAFRMKALILALKSHGLLDD
jgi:hypothetical protein